jgi:hypothetical protein
MDVAVPTPRRVERARAHRRAVIEARSALIVQAIALLCFVMPFDGFREVTRIGGPTGTSVTNLVGYAVFAIAALRLPSIVRSQTGTFWLWVGAYALGTAAGAIAALTGPTPFGGSVITLWQMVGLWALTTYAVASPHGGRLVVKAFLLGMVASLGLYLVMHSLGIRVGETSERTLTVGGYQANQASYDAVSPAPINGGASGCACS